MKWIPVDEKMPEGGKCGISDTVLVTASNLVDDFHVVRTDKYDVHSKSWEHHYPENDMGRITAWMPFPEPYKKNKRKART